MKAQVYNAEGKAIGEAELPKSVFEVEPKPDVVHRAVLVQQARRRQISAHAKGRGEVSGGGRKPWSQKHTGRARHGSTRSPIWVGGGVTHGPSAERNFDSKLNKKMRRKALFMVLAEKAKRKQLVLLDGLALEAPKAKSLEQLLKKLPCDLKNSMIVLPNMNENVIRAARNLSRCATMQAKDINALDLLSVTYVVLPKESLEVIEKTFTA